MAVLHGIQPVEIVHRDLKAANVLLGEADGGGSVAKVADFGLAKTMETFQSTVRGQTRTRNGGAGTLAWKAPETFKGNYSRKSDVFGFAMIVYETVCRKPPFNGQAEPEILAKLNEANMFKVNKRLLKKGETAEEQKADWLDDLQESLEERRPDLEHVEIDCPEELRDLMRHCWADDADARPTIQAAADILQKLGIELGVPDPAELTEFLQAVESNKIERVREMHEKRSTLCAEAGNFRITALHRAVLRAGHTKDETGSSSVQEILDLLLGLLPATSKAVDATTVWGTTSFMLACEMGDVITATKLIQAGCDVRKKDTMKNQNGFEKATALGHTAFLSKLEEHLPDNDLVRTETRRDWERSRPVVQQRLVRESINIAFERMIFWAHATDGCDLSLHFSLFCVHFRHVSCGVLIPWWTHFRYN